MEIKVKGVVNSSDNNLAYIVSDDPRANYSILNPDAPEDYNPSCVEWVEPFKVDYGLCRAEGDVALPQSFLQIDSVEQGAEWYRANSPYPDLVCDMLARYEWGDLRYTTPKEFSDTPHPRSSRTRRRSGSARCERRHRSPRSRSSGAPSTCPSKTDFRFRGRESRMPVYL